MNSLKRLRHSVCNSQLAQALSSSCNQPKKALVFLAPGVCETECVTVVEVLRRGGTKVTLASIEGSDPVKGANGICILPEVGIGDICSPYDAMVLPGGHGCVTCLAACERVGQLLQMQEKKCNIIAAICTAPTVLHKFCIGAGKNLTSDPACEQAMRKGDLYCYKREDVVVDGFLITSRGPATALKFALTILLHLCDEKIACQVAKDMLVK